MSVYNFNQFVRGELFVHIDSLMTWSDPPRELAKEEFDAILKLSNLVIKFICKWISLIPKYYQYYIESLQCPNLYMVSLKHAIPCALPEISEMLKLCFGLGNRCKGRLPYFNQRLNEKLKSGQLGTAFQKQSVTTFYSCKGYDGIVDIITKTDHKCPLKIIVDVLEPLISALNIVKFDSPNQDSSVILNEIKDRFSSLNEKNIKELSQSLLEKLYNIFCNISLNKTGAKSGKESILRIFFSLAIQLITSSYIQKKSLE